MYRLTSNTIDILNSNKELKLKVAIAMGVGEIAIYNSIARSGGISIATNHDALKCIEENTGFTINEIRELLPTGKPIIKDNYTGSGSNIPAGYNDDGTTI